MLDVTITLYINTKQT